MKILVAGDSFVTVEDFKNAFSEISKTNDVRFILMNEEEKLVPASDSEKGLRNFSARRTS